MKPVPIWDLPLRLFHWSLVALVAAAIISGEMGGNAMEWHARAGYAILALLLFRFLWGFCGGTYARFQHCLPSPRVLFASLPERRARHRFGHTPMGKIALMFVLGALWFQSGSGLFANNDDDLKGPFYHWIGKASSDWVTGLHKDAVYVIGALIFLHVAAIIYYRFVKKDDLITPMILGWRMASKDTPVELAATGGSTLLGLSLMAASGGLIWYLVEFL